jgi:hypothetical protein
LSIPWCETQSGPGKRSAAGTAVSGRRRGTDAPVITTLRGRRDSLRPGPAGPCARRSDRRGSSILRSRAPAVRPARADRRAAALAAAAALTCPVRTAAELRRLAMEPEQLAGEQCLNAERPVHEHPPVSGGRPASRPRCATGARSDIRRYARLLSRLLERVDAAHNAVICRRGLAVCLLRRSAARARSWPRSRPVSIPARRCAGKVPVISITAGNGGHLAALAWRD